MARPAGRAYICADLACSRYVREKRQTELGVRVETLTVAERIARVAVNLDGFLVKVLDGDVGSRAG